MSFMVEKGIRERICQALYRYAKANNKYIKDYDRNKESSYLKYWDENNSYGWEMSQKLPVNDFKWVEDISEFVESFRECYNEEVDEGYFLEIDIPCPENWNYLHSDLPFFTWRNENWESWKTCSKLVW